MVPREAMLGTAENHWWTLLPTLKIWSFTVKHREFEELDSWIEFKVWFKLNLFSTCICSGLFSVWSAVHLNPVLSKVDYDAQNRQYCSTVESSHTKFLEQSQYCSVVSIQRKFKKMFRYFSGFCKTRLKTQRSQMLIFCWIDPVQRPLLFCTRSAPPVSDANKREKGPTKSEQYCIIC